MYLGKKTCWCFLGAIQNSGAMRNKMGNTRANESKNDLYLLTRECFKFLRPLFDIFERVRPHNRASFEDHVLLLFSETHRSVFAEHSFLIEAVDCGDVVGVR